MDSCEKTPVRDLDSKDIPVWGQETIPEGASLLMFVTELNQQCGQYVPFVYKLPTSMLVPSGTSEGNVVSLPGNGATIVVPERQVRAGYVYNNTPNDIRLADSEDETKPMFLITGVNAADPTRYDVVTDGVYRFPNGHSYVIGYTYYLGLLGQPTTEDTGVPLFEVLDANRISVKIG